MASTNDCDPVPGTRVAQSMGGIFYEYNHHNTSDLSINVAPVLNFKSPSVSKVDSFWGMTLRTSRRFRLLAMRAGFVHVAGSFNHGGSASSAKPHELSLESP